MTDSAENSAAPLNSYFRPWWRISSSISDFPRNFTFEARFAYFAFIIVDSSQFENSHGSSMTVIESNSKLKIVEVFPPLMERELFFLIKVFEPSLKRVNWYSTMIGNEFE